MKEECIKSQVVTLNDGRGKHLNYLPYALTEQGIAMLSGMLLSPTAIEVNIRIMRAFTYRYAPLSSQQRPNLSTFNQHRVLSN